MSTSPTTYRFLAAELQTARRVLRVDGRDCQLGARAFDLLLALVERRDRVVSKNELLEIVWPRMVVEENNLPVQVSSLRKLLGPNAIATVPGRGYRFVAPLLEADDAGADASEDGGGASNDADAPPAARSEPSTTGSALYGRAEEVVLVATLLEAHRLVTVVGAGGIGKSRLARVVAAGQHERFRDGVSWIELSGLADPALLPHALAQPLGLSVPERDGSQTLVDSLARREMLLVIDNCEHLLEPLAVLVERLLDAGPGLRVLATSQEPLRVQVEQQVRLEPLEVPYDAEVPNARGYGALLLFESRVRAASPRFELAEADLALAIDVCRQLDGLPLAIELAAARVPLLGLRTVHGRLRERFRLLTAGTRTALRRHQTLRAAMEWSHGLLEAPQRAVFRRLGVFSGGFTMELAQGVCADDEHDAWTVLEQLAALVDKSLVVAEPGEPVRYRLLESARAFALEQLADADETTAVVRRHAQTMLQFLRRADDGNMDSTLRTDEYARLVLPEVDNLRAAYAWASGDDGDRAIALGLATHAGPMIDYSTEFTEWVLAQRVNLDAEGVDAATAARYWRARAAVNMLGPLSIPELLDAAQRAAAAYRALARPRRLFTALRLAAIWRRNAGDRVGAHAAIDEADALIEPDWPAEFRIVVLRFRAYSSREAGDHDAAHRRYVEAVRLARAAGDWRLEVIERTHAAELLWEIGEHDRAERDIVELLDAMRHRTASDSEMIDAMTILVAIRGEVGRVAKATAAARDALPVMRRMPKFRFEGYAQLLWRLARPEAAARVLGALAALHRERREQHQINDDRIARSTLAALTSALPAERLAAEMAAGGRLGASDVCSLVAEALEAPLAQAASHAA
jgi:predicted ATPase/DNA-binding winged helix-turn-helix (wHTH) protein